MIRELFGSLFILTLGLGGCATIPPLPTESEVHILNIQRALQCEIAQAFEKSGGQSGLFRNRAYTAKLELQVTDTDNKAAAFSLQGPLTAVMGEKVNFSMSGGLDQEAFREGEVNFSGQFATAACDRPTTDDKKTWLVGGETGLEEWLTRVDLSSRPNAGTLGSISYVIRFTYKPSGKIEPKFTLIPLPLDSVVPSATLTAARKRLYRLTLTMKEIPSTPGPTIVELTNASATKIANALADAASEQERQRQLASTEAEIAKLKAEIAERETDPSFLAPEKQAMDVELKNLEDKRDELRRRAPPRIVRVRRAPRLIRRDGLTIQQQQQLERDNRLFSIDSQIRDALE